MKGQDPFFSVVIPTHNRSELLEKSVNSVLQQSFENFELLIVDDHSTDDTKIVADRFGDKRVRYMLNDRSPGGAGARNTGVLQARGAWVAFLDDDDMWMPAKLQRQFDKIMETEESVGLIYTGYKFTDSESMRYQNSKTPDKEGWIEDELLLWNCVGTYSSVAIKADLIRRLGGLDERFPALQDQELYVRIAGQAKFAFVRDYLVLVHRSHGIRISTDYDKKLAGYQLFLEKYSERINRNMRLRHRYAAQVFMYALLKANKSLALRNAYWTLAGLVVDPKHLYQIVGRLTLLLIRSWREPKGVT